MNYEIKSIAPLSVLLNALRIFVVVGFVVALISFFIVPNPNLRISGFMQKIAATFLFTLVYTLVISIALTFISWLYNVWTARFKGISFHLEQNND